jgi:hypothetical protein
MQPAGFARKSAARRMSLETLEARWTLDATVTFNEVMYNPAGSNEALEWVELHNQLSVNIDLSGWRLDGGVDYRFPQGVILPARGYVVVAADPTALKAATGFTGARGPFTSDDRLSNGGEVVELKDNSDRVVDLLDYGDNDPWPVGPDGSGSSLAKRTTFGATEEPASWTTSAQLGGTPGAVNFPTLAEQTPVTSTIVSDSSTWRFNDTGTDLGTAWRASGYNDASWGQSPGPFQAGQLGGSSGSHLVGYWNFDDNVLDQSASGIHDGTRFGATFDANVPPAIGSGKSLSFAGSTSSPGVNPISVPGLVLWLDADASRVTKDASNRVTGWSDATGATNNTAAENVAQTIAARQPLWVQSGMNGRPVIRFDGIDDKLENTTNNLLTPGVDRTIIVVGDGNDAGSGGTPVTLRQTAGVFAAQLALTNGTFYTYTDAQVRNITSANLLSTVQQPFLSIHRTSGTTLSLDVNGTNRALSGNPIANWESGGTGFTIGGRNDQSLTVNGPGWQIWNGDIAEVLIFNRNLSPTELADVSTYLNQKYALPSSTPATSDRVEIPANAALNSSKFTLAYWMQDPGQTTGVGSSVGHTGHNRLTSRGTNSFETAVSNTAAAGGNSSAKFFSQGAWTETTHSTTPGAWTHMAYVSDGTTLKVFANGTQVFSGPRTLAPSGPLVIGASATGGEGFVGRIDDVALWSEPLSQASIQALASGTLSPPEVVVSIGNPVDLGPTTHYFRTSFNFLNDPARTTLSLTPFVDDGAVYYLNGVEVYRRNMPAGTVNYNTLASTSVGVPTAGAAVSIPATSLVVGQNVLAVEVHQSSLANEDMFLSASVSATVFPAPPGEAVPLRFNEIEAANAAAGQFRIEIQNTGATPINIGGYVIRSSDAQADYVLPASSISGGGYITVTEAQLGYRPADGDRLFLLNPAASGVIDAAVVDERLRGRSTQHEGRWLFPSVATFGAANTFDFEDDIVINEIMYHARPTLPTPGTPPTYTTTNLVLVDATRMWRYNQSNTDLGQGWQNGTYSADDIGWDEGPALLGHEDVALPDPIRTPLLDPELAGQFRPTIYFQTTFAVGDLAAIDTLLLRHIIDDGAVFYINGTEVHRTNLPATGPIAFNTPASPSVGDAAYSGQISIPKSALVAGTNRLSVEVHQTANSSSDIVFGAELLAAVETSPGTPGTPFEESPEQWIEIYNRGTAAVDLSGWSFGDGINYEFPAGTTLAAGQFLVVPWSMPGFAALYPGVAAAGPFSGSLSRGGERIELLDANLNVADEVRYYDAEPWPEYADGGGSSLELRDPRADNTKAASWAASDESERNAWQTITYTGIASASAVGPDGQWNEFVLGLLDGGEMLLDDIRVVQTPSGTPIELIQNGTFENDPIGTKPATWRTGGNHGSHGETVVVVDPDDPTNNVLHLVAKGPSEQLFNHLETTLKNGANFVTIQNGTEYQISFRAKPITGSTQVNTRLYFNRLAQTNVLDVATQSGTPGAVNSQRVSNAGPTFNGLTHSPVVPAANTPVTVSVAASDPNGVASATLWYSVAGGAWQSATMGLNGGVYRGTIPGQSANAVVQFYVVGVDGLGASATYPADGVGSRAMLRFADGLPDSSPLDDFLLIMTPADTTFLHTPTNALSNDWLGATVIYRGTEVYYDIGVHLKGSERGRGQDVRFGYNLKFPAESLFRGVYDRLSVDRSSPFDVSSRELLVTYAANRAGGIPGAYSDLIRLVAPRSQQTGDATLVLDRYGGDYLDTKFQDGGDGTLFELELVYYPTSTVDGNRESLKVPYPAPDNVIGIPNIGNMGDDKERYRHTYLIKNNRDQDDYSRIMAMAKAFSLSGPAFLNEIANVIDVDEFLRVYALENLFGVEDTYVTGGLLHNAMFYVRPEDGRVLLLPQDMDYAFAKSSTGPLVQNNDLAKMIASPAYAHAYYGHLHDLVTKTFNAAYVNTWVAHFDSLLAESFSSQGSFINTRSASVLSQLNSTVPSVAFNITTPNSTVNTTTATVQGTGWINVREIRVAGTDEALPLTWNTVTGWQAILPVNFGANALTLEAYDFQGTLVASDTITITSTVSSRPLQDFLRVSEIMYHPADPSAAELAAGFGDADDFEFLELVNISDSVTLDLSTVKFDQGITIEFATAVITSLAPGTRLVIVEDPAAFAFRYPGVPIAGQYSGRLDNAGEMLTMRLTDSSLVQTFTYDDTGPGWYPSTDGDGYSLVIVNALAATSTWNDAASWRASGSVGGSPGEEDSTLVAGDVNGDRRVDLVDLAILQSHFGLTTNANRAQGDLNGDGAVTRADVAELARNFGRDVVSPVPQAASVVVAAGNERAKGEREAAGALRVVRRTAHSPAAIESESVDRAFESSSESLLAKHRATGRDRIIARRS